MAPHTRNNKLVSTTAARLQENALPIRSETPRETPDRVRETAHVPALVLPDWPHFQQHPWLASGHLQTIAAGYLKGKLPAYRAKRHFIQLADGDHLVLHDDCPSAWQSGDPIVILLHGLGGSYRSHYVVRTAFKLNTLGIRTFAMDLRGCGAGFKYARHPTHAGRSDDAAFALSCIRKMCPASPLIMVGYSMSGNVVLKMAGEFGTQVPALLDSVVAVSPPVDLESCSRSFRKGFNRFYDHYYLTRLLKAVARKERDVCAHKYKLLEKQPRTLREFDDIYTAPLCGFRDSTEYYAAVSSTPLIPNISVPTLIVTADDDPIIPLETVVSLQRPESVLLHVTRGGGHLGFVGRSGIDPDRQWLDWRIVDWAKLRFGLETKS